MIPGQADQASADAEASAAKEALLPPPYSVAQFEILLESISSGQNVSAAELLPFLCCPLKQHRQSVNFRLAEAYKQANHLRQAAIFIQRSWLLSEFSDDVLPLYVEIFKTLKDCEAVGEAYKRIGIKAADSGRLAAAMYYFDQWHNTYSYMRCVDKFRFDFDILDAMKRAVSVYLPSVAAIEKPHAGGGKLRIGYLLKGVVDVNSILIKNIYMLAEFHDRKQFDLFVFCPEPSKKVKESKQGEEILEQFRALNVEVFTAPDIENADRTQIMIATAKQIAAAGIDILVTSAALCDFGHYFISCLRPAPKIVGLVQGPPPQFAPPDLDWCISWSKHPLIDTPVNCTLVNFSRLNPIADDRKTLQRSDIGLPADACVLMTSGRAAKFQSEDYWRAISEVLQKHDKAHYVVVGARSEEIQCLDSIVSSQVRTRVHFMGWREDVLSLLPLSDITVDTYPSGGGQSLVEAMFCGKPLVAHRNDYFACFDQNNWSPVEDFVGDLETVVERGNFEAFKSVMSRLIEDQIYRAEIAGECLARVKAMSGEDSVRRAVQECEKVYLSLKDS